MKPPLAALGLLVLLIGTAVVGALVVRELLDTDLDGPPLPPPVLDPDAAGRPNDADVHERPAGVPADAEPAIVVRVVDGDTLRVVLAPGGGVPDGGSLRVRLLNIDTPELARDGEPAGCLADAAAARTAQLAGEGDLVWLAADREDRDRFDRLLRGVWTSDGVFVNQVLAEEGYATALLVGRNDRFHAEVVAAERRAATAGRGVWGPACAG